MHTIDFQTPELINFRQNTKEKPILKKYKKYFGISIAFHLCLVTLVIVSFNLHQKNQPNKKTITENKVVSYVYFSPTNSSKKTQEINSSKLEEKIAQQATLKTKTASQVNQTNEIETPRIEQPTKTNKEPEATLSNKKPISMLEPKHKQAPLVLTTDNKTQTLTIRDPTANASDNGKDIFNTGIRALVAKDLNQLSNQKYSQMAQTATAEFQSNLVSPSIDAPVFSAEYLFLKESNVAEIECDNSIKSNLQLLSTITGGNIKCRDKNFQQFIDKRLEQNKLE